MRGRCVAPGIKRNLQEGLVFGPVATSADGYQVVGIAAENTLESVVRYSSRSLGSAHDEATGVQIPT